jgi:YQGE family putative transporter
MPHWLWNRMQLLAIWWDCASYIITAGHAVITFLLDKRARSERSALWWHLAAFLLYVIGRDQTCPPHRHLHHRPTLFALGGLANALLFNAAGVIFFTICLLLSKPLQDIAYFPIQMQVIDTVSAIEQRNKFAYIFSQEFGFYIGRFAGCGLFILTTASTRSPSAMAIDYWGRAIAFHLMADGLTGCRDWAKAGAGREWNLSCFGGRVSNNCEPIVWFIFNDSSPRPGLYETS